MLCKGSHAKNLEEQQSDPLNSTHAQRIDLPESYEEKGTRKFRTLSKIIAENSVASLSEF